MKCRFDRLLDVLLLDVNRRGVLNAYVEIDQRLLHQIGAETERRMTT